MELFEDLEGTGPETARDAIASWDDSSIPGRPAVPWWDSTGPESTETRYLVRDTGPGPRFPIPPSARNRGIFGPSKLLKRFTVAESVRTARNRSRKK